MDTFRQFRLVYFGAAPHSFYVAFCWVMGGFLGSFADQRTSIIFFLAASMFNFPIGELLRRKFFHTPDDSVEIASLKRLFMLMSFIIPMSLPLVYFACRDNVNLFYPSLAIIVGAHDLPFYYGYQLRSFIVAGTAIWIIGTMNAFYFSGSFTITAYATGLIILLLGFFNYRKVRAELSV